MTGKILIVGDSHTIALRAAVKAKPWPGIKVFRVAKPNKGKTYGGALVEDIAASADSRVCFVSAFGGNHHQMLMFEHPQPFDIVEGNGSIGAGRQIIPFQVMLSYFKRALGGEDAERLRIIRASRAGRVLYLCPPPPKEDEDHIRRNVEPVLLRNGSADAKITPASIRAKLWRIQREAARQLCATLDIEHIECPPGTVEADSFLRREFYAADATHANAAYGELVLRQIEALPSPSSTP